MIRSAKKIAAAAALSAALAGCSAFPGGEQAACVDRALQASPDRAAAGERVQVSGGRFAEGCPDVLVNGEPVEELRPREEVELRLQQGSREWPLATAEVGEDLSISERVRLPGELRSGEARVIARDYTARIQVSGG